MTATNRESSIVKCLVHEGGYTNHPSDPGGPTNWGITIFDARKHWKPGATAADVKAMPKSVAIDIYRAKYWAPIRCDEMPAGLDYALFDYGVNSGIARAGKVLRRVVGLPDDTWAVTDAVTAAVAKRDPGALIAAVCDERLRFLRSLRTWPTFGGGWGRRVAEVRAAALHMAAAAGKADRPPAPAAPATVAPAKGIVPPPAAARKVIVQGGGAGGVAAGAGLWGWVEVHPIEAGVLALAGVAAIGGAVYALNRWHRARQEAPTPGLVPVPALEAA